MTPSPIPKKRKAKKTAGEEHVKKKKKKPETNTIVTIKTEKSADSADTDALTKKASVQKKATNKRKAEKAATGSPTKAHKRTFKEDADRYDMPYFLT